MTLNKTGRSKQAKARKTGETVSYRVWIIGIAWQGFEGCADYSFDHEPTLQEIKRKAGDWQTIVDYQIDEIRTIRYTDGERRIHKTVRGWVNGEESIDKCCTAYGC